MEELKSNMNQTGQRDYDKKPIIIKDHNPQMALYSFIFVLIPLIFILMYFFGHYGRLLFSLFFFIIPPLKVYRSTKDKRKIIFKNEKIEYYHENNVLKDINIKDIESIKKGFQDYYTKKQNLSYFGEFLTIFFFPFVMLSNFGLIITKFLFHSIIYTNNNYNFYDSIIIEGNNEIINVMPTSEKEYKEICEYIKNIKDIKCNELQIFFKYSYGYEDNYFI